MSLIRRAVGRARRELTSWAHEGGYARRYLYYRFISNGFKREQDAVGAGIAEYSKRTGIESGLYLLRRNIHMMEKGLTMQPRRNKFATEYNQQTVESYCAAVKRYADSDWIGSDEHKWMTSVLAQYFDATRSAQDPRVAQLEGQFNSCVQLAGPSSCAHGPHTPTMEPTPVCIDDLIVLAERRRSVRWFQDRPVDRAIVDKAVRVAREAPTACNRQPYSFRVFDDKQSVRQVAEIPMGTRGYVHQLQGIIVVVGDLSAFFDERDRHLIYIDSSLAVTGLLLGLESQGVATCVINWPDLPERERAMKTLLGLEDYERVVMLIAYGYADPQGLTPFSAKGDITQLRRFRSLEGSA